MSNSNDLVKTIQSIARLDPAVLRDLGGRGGESYTGEGRQGWRNPIRDDTGPILAALVVASRSTRALEIGTAYGLSGTYLAAALAPGGSLDTIEFCGEVARQAERHFAETGLPVRVLQGDALEVIEGLDGSYDLLFLDANKRSYLEHLLAIARKLTEGALIIADNVTDRASEMHDFLDYVTARLEHVIIPTQCGLLVARWR